MAEILSLAALRSLYREPAERAVKKQLDHLDAQGACECHASIRGAAIHVNNSTPPSHHRSQA